jgi:UDP-MurNAc hydroxylase
MRADGFNPTILKEPLEIGSTTIKVIPHQTGSIADIDSAIIVKYRDGTREHCVANANDVIFEDNMTHVMDRECRGCDVLLCGYTGAGPFPQTYFDIDDPQLPIRAEEKKLAFFERYRKLISTVQPKITIPFAGQYLLGGKLTCLNPYRGVADAVEVLAFDDKAVVLDEGGEISTSDLCPDRVRTLAYDAEDIHEREKEIANHQFDYERLIAESEAHQLPLNRLLASAVKKATEKSECEEDYYFVIHLADDNLAIINTRIKADPAIRYSKANSGALPVPRSEIYIDPRYLFGLLTGVYHWNNAEVGSQYFTRRYPNVLNRKAQSFLSFLVI